MLWKKKGSLESLAPSSPNAVRLGIFAIRGYQNLLILPNDPISQDFGTKIDSLASEAESSPEESFEQIADTLNAVVTSFGDSQRKALEKSIEATHASLREVLLSLDGAVNSSESLEKSAAQTTERMQSLQTVTTFEEIILGLQHEVKTLTEAIDAHRASAKTIRKVCSDQIDELRTKLRVAERSVRTDHLTKLSNRSAFDFMLTSAIARCAMGEEYHLAVLDMNDFKDINDTHGHIAGDTALMLFAQRLSETFGVFGGNGTQIARLGGDEFAVVYKGGELQLAAKLERVNSLLEKKPMQLKSQALVLSASYGYVKVRPNHTIESAYHEADLRMYYDKSRRKAA